MSSNTVLQKSFKEHKHLSNYARFHFAFLGYSFLDKRTKKTILKSVLFRRDSILAISMSLRQKPSEHYELVDSKGWKNGNLLPIQKRLTNN